MWLKPVIGEVRIDVLRHGQNQVLRDGILQVSRRSNMSTTLADRPDVDLSEHPKQAEVRPDNTGI